MPLRATRTSVPSPIHPKKGRAPPPDLVLDFPASLRLPLQVPSLFRDLGCFPTCGTLFFPALLSVTALPPFCLGGTELGSHGCPPRPTLALVLHPDGEGLEPVLSSVDSAPVPRGDVCHEDQAVSRSLQRGPPCFEGPACSRIGNRVPCTWIVPKRFEVAMTASPRNPALPRQGSRLLPIPQFSQAYPRRHL